MIEIRNVYAGYDREPVLRGVSLSVKKGCVTALIGPNGCGKSTLLKVMDRLLKPTSGEALFDGKPVFSYNPKAYARRVAMLSQLRDTPSLTVRGMVAHGRYPHLAFPRTLSEADNRAVVDAIHAAGIAHLSERPLCALSGGERQKAYVAMTLAQGGEVLLMDEPTTFLDIGCQMDVLSLIGEMRSAGRTIVLVLHDIRQALETSDYVAVMRDGQVDGVVRPDEQGVGALIERAFGVKMVARDGKHYEFIRGG